MNFIINNFSIILGAAMAFVVLTMLLYMRAMMILSKINSELPSDKYIVIKQLKIKDYIRIGTFKYFVEAFFSKEDTLVRVYKDDSIYPNVNKADFEIFLKRYVLAKRFIILMLFLGITTCGYVYSITKLRS